MCGIVGVFSLADSAVSPRKSSLFFQELLLEAQSRGRDASGLATLDCDRISVFKAPQPAASLLKERSVQNHIGACEASSSFFAFGHSRMETDGSYLNDTNNQPVVKDGCVLVHNGIIVNHEALWKESPLLSRTFEVDSEVIASLLMKDSLAALPRLRGSFSFAAAFNDSNSLLLATNTGSLYFLHSPQQHFFAFASEQQHLLRALKAVPLSLESVEPVQLSVGSALWVDLNTLKVKQYQWTNATSSERTIPPHNRSITVSPLLEKAQRSHTVYNFSATARTIERAFEVSHRAVQHLRRCTKCILPETMPFIRFDAEGICNYCKKHEPRETRGVSALQDAIAPLLRSKGKGPNCIVCLSGGRDSSYALHYVKKVLGLRPIAYSYDWGMLTDLGRRNQARMTGALGVEHLLVAADIRAKRTYIRKNILAWLKKPSMGMIPLFMAGDKQYFYHVHRLRRELDLDLIFYADNALEKTDFKYGFAGVELSPEVGKAYDIGRLNSLKLLSYYAGQYLTNPAYLNTSLFDTFTAYLSSYFVPKDYLYLYRYLLWEENEITQTLTRSYDWELALDSKFSWRIGDGTAGFYNYLYYTVAGFTEHDTFRSNQVREGVISRQQALEMAEEGNRPRLESIAWYLQTLDLDPEATFKQIHQITPLYFSTHPRSSGATLKSTIQEPKTTPY